MCEGGLQNPGFLTITGGRWCSLVKGGTEEAAKLAALDAAEEAERQRKRDFVRAQLAKQVLHHSAKEETRTLSCGVHVGQREGKLICSQWAWSGAGLNDQRSVGCKIWGSAFRSSQRQRLCKQHLCVQMVEQMDAC